MTARSLHMISVARSGKSVFQYSTAEYIAEEVYNAVTDEADCLRYTAGPDATAMYAERLRIGDEAFRKMVATQLLPDSLIFAAWHRKTSAV